MQMLLGAPPPRRLMTLIRGRLYYFTRAAPPPAPAARTYHQHPPPAQQPAATSEREGWGARTAPGTIGWARKTVQGRGRGRGRGRGKGRVWAADLRLRPLDVHTLLGALLDDLGVRAPLRLLQLHLGEAGLRHARRGERVFKHVQAGEEWRLCRVPFRGAAEAWRVSRRMFARQRADASRVGTSTMRAALSRPNSAAAE